MPDISKLSGTLIDSVGKVDGVLKGDIASILGLTVPSGTAYTPPLDTYTGATAAYSVRKLSSTYSGPCIEAYRVSDGATQDIGFDGDGLIDTSAIETFASGGEVRVRTWYDQSGNSNHVTQATASQTPQIYDGTAVITSNGKPAIDSAAVNNSGFPISLGLSHPFTSFVVGETDGALGSGRWYGFSPQVNAIYNASIYAGAFLATTADLRGTEHMMRAVFNGVNSNLKAVSPTTIQEVAGNSGSDANFTYLLRRRNTDTGDGVIANEVIFWDSEQSATNLTGIESNLNDYYQIANLPASSSGLLYDYPDAAAAYSVRSLSNNAIKCMRVRRTVSPFDEQDIGFDSNGDLDTSAIATFGGSDPLTVSAWYDQSGQSNHATQVTAGSQPTIYDGAAVITENGKPALDFGLNANQLTLSSTFTTASQPNTAIIVSRLATSSVNDGQDLVALDGSSTNTMLLSFQQNNYTPDEWQAYAGTLYQTNTASDDNQNIHFGLFNGASSTYHLNGTSIASGDFGSSSVSGLTIGANAAGVAAWTGNVQEVVFYDSNQSSNRTGIESNINTYYSIY